MHAKSPPERTGTPRRQFPHCRQFAHKFILRFPELRFREYGDGVARGSKGRRGAFSKTPTASNTVTCFRVELRLGAEPTWLPRQTPSVPRMNTKSWERPYFPQGRLTWLPSLFFLLARSELLIFGQSLFALWYRLHGRGRSRSFTRFHQAIDNHVAVRPHFGSCKPTSPSIRADLLCGNTRTSVTALHVGVFGVYKWRKLNPNRRNS